MKTNRIYLTDADRGVIHGVLREHRHRAYAPFLESELRRAEIVPEEEIPRNVVTLHSRAKVIEEVSGKSGVITVVPPSLAHPGCGYVSILAPAGAAVIGLSEGQVLDLGSHAMRRRYRVVQVQFQPEAENRVCIAS